MIYWTTKENPTGYAGHKAEHMPKNTSMFRIASYAECYFTC